MAFILTSLAGLSTMIGTIFIFIKTKHVNSLINFALSFAAGVMITVSITDLIPESYSLLNKDFTSVIYILISINIGIILSMFIDSLIPSSNNLYRVGVISMLAIILHNIPEGIATYMASVHDQKLGICLALAISLHNIPEGITISLPIYYATKSKKKACFYTFISGISELVGAVITSLFLKDFINDFVMAILLGIISGIMIHISCYELLVEAVKKKKMKLTIISVLLGSLIMIISHLLIS